MKLSVSQTAKLTGVSVRTLHYYDEIGILKPTQTSQSGYRFYDSAALETLQQILFYKELGFALKDIANILSHPDHDKQAALQKHRELLLLKRGQIDSMIALVDNSLQKGDTKMKSKQVTAADIDAAKAKYAAEAAEKWGKTSAYAESEKRYASYSDAEKVELFDEAGKIFAAFAELRHTDPSDDAPQALVKQWQAHITEHYYPCTDEILSGLGVMYTADLRFTENIDKYGEGTADFMSRAIAAYCKKSD